MEKNRNNEEVLAAFSGLIIEMTVAQLLPESPPAAKGFTVGHRQSFTILYTLVTTNEPARTITLDRRPKEKRGCVRS